MMEIKEYEHVSKAVDYASIFNIWFMNLIKVVCVSN